MNDPPNFDGLARLYRWMEWLSFGPFLALTRAAFLPKAASARRALVIGDGDGRFTARLLRSNPGVHVDAVDASSRMLEELLRRAGPNAARVKVHRTDARNWQPRVAEPYDLIATHFFLDCLNEEDVQRLAARISEASNHSALWLISEFAVPEGQFGVLVARPLVSALYWSFSQLTGLTVRTLPNYGAALRFAGFTRIERRHQLGGLLVSELWTLGGSEPMQRHADAARGAP